METMTLGQRVSRSIFLEASSIKAGNVHPHASFSDMRFADFEVASIAIGRAFGESLETGSLGRLVLAGVRAMVQAVSVNTSLGTILLLAPMVLCPPSSFPTRFSEGASKDDDWNPDAFELAVSAVVRASTAEDSERIYEAIRMANPGGLGRVESQDVLASAQAPICILEAMQIASSWDDVALQYANGYTQVIEWTVRLLELVTIHPRLIDAVRYLQIEILASRPDSLIVRKHGKEMGSLVQSQASAVLASVPFGSPGFEQAWDRFDAFLREDGNRKNPGTTADLIAAAIFLAGYGLDQVDA
jgi:triphosphoribosyl-dephospho-CoA synthase